MATLRKKPRVGIIHSTKSKITTAGKDLAVYLGVCLQLGGMPCAAWLFLGYILQYNWIDLLVRHPDPVPATFR